MSAHTENMNVEVEVRDSATAVVTVAGELDVDTATFLHTHLANQLQHGRHHLVMDLETLEFMDSSGLRVLIQAARETHDRGGDLHIAAPTPAVRRLLELTGFSTATPVHASVEEALAALV